MNKLQKVTASIIGLIYIKVIIIFLWGKKQMPLPCCLDLLQGSNLLYPSEFAGRTLQAIFTGHHKSTSFF